MRVWDISPEFLCNKHLLAQHHEIHCIWNIIIQNKKGFAHHPEVMRWRNYLAGLTIKHGETVKEMKVKNMQHNTSLGIGITNAHKFYLPISWQSINKQIEILKSKNCECKISNIENKPNI